MMIKPERYTKERFIAICMTRLFDYLLENEPIDPKPERPIRPVKKPKPRRAKNFKKY